MLCYVNEPFDTMRWIKIEILFLKRNSMFWHTFDLKKDYRNVNSNSDYYYGSHMDKIVGNCNVSGNAFPLWTVSAIISIYSYSKNIGASNFSSLTHDSTPRYPKLRVWKKNHKRLQMNANMCHAMTDMNSIHVASGTYN